MTREKRLNSRSTGRALLASFLALLLCFATLLGTTYAWFTDSATTGTNTIKAGNLKVDLLYQTDTTNDTWSSANNIRDLFKQASVDNDTTVTTLTNLDNVLWEPGATYETAQLKVVNNGSLAAKYQLEVHADYAKLSDGTSVDIDKVFNVTVGDQTLADFNSDNTDKTLQPKAEVGPFTLKIQMKQEADNTYQGMQIGAVYITLVATQASSEYDSFNNTYDRLAEYPNIVLPSIKNTSLTASKKDSTSGTEKVTEYSYSNSLVEVTYTPNDGADATAAAPQITFEETTVDKAATVIESTNKDVIAYDFKITDNNGNALSNTGLTKLSFDAPKGLQGVVLYHDGQKMTVVDSADNVKDNNQYYYDSENGRVTFVTSSYSEFALAFDPAVILIGTTCYYDLPTALNAANSAANGATIELLQDIDLSSAAKTNYPSYSDNYYYALIDTLNNTTINGNNHKITMPEKTFFADTLKNSTIKDTNIVIDSWPVVEKVSGSVNFNNVDVSGEYTGMSWNVSAYVNHVWESGVVLNFTDCDANVVMTGGGGTGYYNAIFIGNANSSFTANFTNCVNRGSIVCGRAAMFAANLYNGSNVTLNINNCINEGLIQSTSLDVAVGPIVAVCGDANTLNVNIDGSNYTKATLMSKDFESNVSIPNSGGGEVKYGPTDATLKLAQNSDSTFTLTGATTAGVDHYVISVATYSSLRTSGTKQQVVTETIEANKLVSNSYTSALKYLSFVDTDWVSANSGAVEDNLAGNTTYTLNDATYYLLSDNTEAWVNATPKAPTSVTVSAYDSNGNLLCSTSLSK
jgi:predicted ribosomally synthesized peptide with SipW-like signal peptide